MGLQRTQIRGRTIIDYLPGRFGAGDRHMTGRVREAETQADLRHALFGIAVVQRLQLFQLRQIGIQLFR